MGRGETWAKNCRKIWACAIGTQGDGTYASVHVSEPVCVSGHDCVHSESGNQEKTRTNNNKNSEPLLNTFPELGADIHDLTEFFKYLMKSQCYDKTHL